MGDNSTEEIITEKIPSNTKLDDNNTELKSKETTPTENPKDSKDVSKVVCKKEKSPRREKSRERSREKVPDKEVNLKSDVFYLEVIDDKTIEKSEETPRPPPTPRRVNKLRDHTSSIFPAGCMGCREDPPSDHVVSPRRFLDNLKPRDLIGQIESTARKRPSSAKPNNVRNPLTGVGVNDDEIKRTHGRRKDGNPLLGEGYETKQVTPSSTRIPPGGYSQGLW